MQLLRWSVLVIAVVALIAGGLYLRRDHVAGYLVNTVLADYGFVVESLSVDSLSPKTVELSGIVLAAQSGTRYRIADLRLMLSGGGTQVSGLAVSRVSIEPGASSTEPVGLGGVLQTILDLPAILPDAEVRIAALSIRNLPELTAISWRSTAGSQVLEFAVGEANFTLSSAPLDAMTHSLTVAAVTGGQDAVFAIDAGITVDGGRRAIDGTAVFQTTEWIPILRGFDILPGELDRFDARLRGDISVALDEPGVGEASISASFELVDQVEATYRLSEGGSADLLVESMSPLRIAAAYPSGSWSMATGYAAGQFTAAGIDAFPFAASHVDCRPGIRCAMTLAVEAAGRTIRGVDIGRLSLSVPLVAEAGEATRIFVDPDVTFSAGALSVDSFSAEAVELAAFSGATVTFADDQWKSTVDVLGLKLSGVTLGNVSVDVFDPAVGELRLGSQTMAASVSVSAGATISRDGLSALLPGLQGNMRLENERIEAELSLVDIYSALTGEITISHRLDHRTGTASARDLRLAFDSVDLSDYVAGWKNAFDIVDGASTADITIGWKPAGERQAFTASLEFGIDSISGGYDDLAFVDVDTRIQASLSAEGRLSVEPSSLSIGLVDIGLPLRGVVADYALDVPGKAVHVENLSLAVLGGEFTADPFDFAAGADANSLILHARSIPLQLVVDLAEVEDLEISGSISGSMPLTIGGDRVRIDGGKLQSDGSGGVIRYVAGSEGLQGVAAGSDLSIVTRSLSNFRYDSLSSDVEYSSSGDLNLKMRLSGVNPDVDATQPVILNLNIENNLPQTLKSLRSIRSIEDILEKRAAR